MHTITALRAFTFVLCLSAVSGLAANHADAAVVRRAMVQPHLYVANYNGNSVTIYPENENRVVRTITAGIANPTALAFDPAGNLYVVNQFSAQVTVYAPGRSQILRTIIPPGATSGVAGLAIDPAGNVFIGVQGNGGFVVEYAAGSTTIVNTIPLGNLYPFFLAFDSVGNLYVASSYSAGRSLAEYAAGSLQLIGTFPVSDFTALAFDAAGNRYVSDYSTNSVLVFPPGSTTPLRTITDGVSEPQALAVDPEGDLMIGGLSLNEYAPGKFYPKRTIAYANSSALAFDSVGRLYRSNIYAIYVYSRATYALINTIYAGINLTYAFAFGP
jgi:DNA-binding beta-propeller fold protein YncE